MRIIVLRSSLSLLLFMPLLCFAGKANVSDFSGTWVLKIEGRNLFVVELEVEGASRFSGRFERPSGMETTNTIFRITDPSTRTDPLVRSEMKDGVLALTFRDDDKDETDFVMQVIGDSAEFGLAGVPPGTGLGPWKLEKSTMNERASINWQPNRSYVIGDSDNANPEMNQIYTLDQQDRMRQPADAANLATADAARRARTKELLSQGLLRTGRDYKQAAFVMQHGDKPEDFLLAHSLAVAAVAKGESTAVWIASATLDRFLQSKGMAQIYGTQLEVNQDGTSFQKQFDMSLVPDSLRVQLGVPSVNTQK